MQLAPLLSALSALVAGLILRAWMLHKFFEVNGDSQLYGSMAKNLLLYGHYAVSDGSGVFHDTLIRLPGYPLFLAACFRLFGMENYFAPVCIQIAAELLGCILLALTAWRIASSHRMAAAQATLWLSALCPFTAVYSVEPLTEALTLFCIALALWSVTRFQDRGDWLSALAFTLSITYAALLRPDGALVGIAFTIPMLRALFAPPQMLGAPFMRRPLSHEWEATEADALVPLQQHRVSASRPALQKAIVCLVLAATPFTLWTIRNYRVFHVIQPLAPRYATDPGEETWPGFQRWTKTWCLDFVSTWQIYWNMPGSPLDATRLPDRAFDSPAQRAETEKLFSDYESNGEELSPSIDDGFAKLASDRIAAHPLRYYVWLPAGRVADMLFRPRVENLPIDLDWWVYSHHYAETRFSWFYLCLNAAFFLLALAGLFLRPRLWPWMLLYFVLRCTLLATIEAPEARYTLEFFPMIFLLGGFAIANLSAKRKRPETSPAAS